MRFKCIGIAECCKLIVTVNINDIKRWKEQKRYDILSQLKWMTYPNGMKLLILPKKQDTQCIFLTKDKRCSIYEDRPEACRSFPASNLDFKCCLVEDIIEEDLRNEDELKTSRVFDTAAIEMMQSNINSLIIEAKLRVNK